jgi:hypothetical protein
MKPENRRRLIDELATAYPDGVSTAEGARTLVKIPRVNLPKGCAPQQTDALVVIEESQPAPQLYVRDLPKLPNGRVPRSTSAVQFGGETWCTFSFNQPWEEDRHTALQFVEGRLRRFALHE